MQSFTCAEGLERTHMAVSTEWDGGKWLCGMRNLLQRKDCIIYSFGSNGETDFEENMLKRTNCKVFTFDPTLSHNATLKVRAIEGLNFLPFGLTSVNRTQADINAETLLGQVRTLPDIMAVLNHTHVDVLKMDVEVRPCLLAGPP